MALKRASKIVGPPADSLAETLEAVCRDELKIIAEYNAQSYELLYLADQVIDEHGSLDSVESEADTLFDYYHIDFLERDLLQDLLWLGDVETFVTFLDHGVIVRAHTGCAAVFVALDVAASIDDVQIAIQNTLHQS